MLVLYSEANAEVAFNFLKNKGILQSGNNNEVQVQLDKQKEFHLLSQKKISRKKIRNPQDSSNYNITTIMSISFEPRLSLKI